MHSELTKRLVRQQLEEAREAGLFGPAVVLEELGYPYFFVRFTTATGAIRVLRFDYECYDTFPVDIEPVDPVTRALLSGASWMTRDNGPFPIHVDSTRPFLCIEATRQYYTYPGHDPIATNAPWEKHRQGMRLVTVVGRIADHFRSGKWA